MGWDQWGQCGVGSLGSVWGGVSGVNVGWDQCCLGSVGSVLAGISGVSVGLAGDAPVGLL